MTGLASHTKKIARERAPKMTSERGRKERERERVNENARGNETERMSE